MDHNHDEDVPTPAFPAATVVSSLLIFFFFAFLIWLTYHYSNKLDVAGPALLTGEQKLAELRGDEDKIIKTYGYDKATGAVRVPVVVAVQRLADEAAANGKLPFPLKPAVKAETPKAPEPKKDEPKKDEPKKEDKK